MNEDFNPQLAATLSSGQYTWLRRRPLVCSPFVCAVTSPRNRAINRSPAAEEEVMELNGLCRASGAGGAGGSRELSAVSGGVTGAGSGWLELEVVRVERRWPLVELNQVARGATGAASGAGARPSGKPMSWRMVIWGKFGDVETGLVQEKRRQGWSCIGSWSCSTT